MTEIQLVIGENKTYYAKLKMEKLVEHLNNRFKEYKSESSHAPSKLQFKIDEEEYQILFNTGVAASFYFENEQNTHETINHFFRHYKDVKTTHEPQHY